MEKTILVVDDDENVCTFLVTALTAQGYKVLSAVDGEEGWTKIKSEKPDLLIADVTMPKMNGMELLKKVREDEEMKDMPVIMLTGLSSDEEIITGLSRGADHYITKPFTINKVLAGIKMIFGPE